MVSYGDQWGRKNLHEKKTAYDCKQIWQRENGETDDEEVSGKERRGKDVNR